MAVLFVPKSAPISAGKAIHNNAQLIYVSAWTFHLWSIKMVISHDKKLTIGGQTECGLHASARAESVDMTVTPVRDMFDSSELPQPIQDGRGGPTLYFSPHGIGLRIQVDQMEAGHWPRRRSTSQASISGSGYSLAPSSSYQRIQAASVGYSRLVNTRKA